MRSRTVVLAVLALSHTACTTTLVVAYQTLTDVRTMEEQTDDARIMGTIKDQLATKQGVGSALQVHVFAHLGRVVVAGIVPVRSLLAADAVAVAHAVPGVRKVDVVFIPVRSSYPRDLTISLKLDGKIVADFELRRSQLEWTVLDGTVVLTGVVDDPAKAARAVEHAKSIDNVTAVRSFIQIRQPTKRREPR